MFIRSLACVFVMIGAGVVPRHGATAAAQSSAPAIPFVPGLTFVFAVDAGPSAVKDIAVGDHEIVVAVTVVDGNGLETSTRIEATDGRGQPLHLTIRRRVLAKDVNDARTQILGFHSDDPLELSGTTLLGPSLAIMRDLQRTGRASMSVRNFAHLSTVTGTLTRTSVASVPFPVIVNGRRVDLPAVRATGQLTLAGDSRELPWESLLLDHPRHPITLRFAYGAFGERTLTKPATWRDVVRIDFPTEGDRAIEDGLRTQCRVEVPGVYFDFDRATLKPESSRALADIGSLLRRQSQWRLRIEGHTDGSGTAAYNLDLSTRRARAVHDALLREHAVGAERLTSMGFGESRPVESNETVAGRARNRRVELVRDSCLSGT